MSDYDLSSFILLRNEKINFAQNLSRLLKNKCDDQILQIYLATLISNYDYLKHINDIEFYYRDLPDTTVNKLKSDALKYTYDNCYYLMKKLGLDVIMKDTNSIFVKLEGKQIECNPLSGVININNELNKDDLENYVHYYDFINELGICYNEMINNDLLLYDLCENIYNHFYPLHDPGYQKKPTLNDMYNYLKINFDN
jgi:hypothetical protein